tara:strand:- start:88 stop:546 length:459 start_codon:yes stop_codon:yes gene_type:complete
MTTGDFVEIQDLQEGDGIMSYNTKTGKFKRDIIISMDRVSNKNMTCSEFTFSEPIKHTVDHPFWVLGKGWCSLDPGLSTSDDHYLPSEEIGLLEPGDKVLLLQENDLIESTFLGGEKFLRYPKTVVTITKLKYNNAFIAGGIVVGTYGRREK